MRDGRYPDNTLHPDKQAGRFPYNPAFLKMRRRDLLPTDGMLAWWKHDEGAGGILTDYVAGTYNGTIRGGGIWGSYSPDSATVLGDYDGGDDIVGMVDPIINAGDHLIIVAAVRPTWVGDLTVISKNGVAGCNYELYLWNAGGGYYAPVFYYEDVGVGFHGYSTVGNTVLINTWNIIIVYYKMSDGNSAMMWLNGVRHPGFWPMGDGNANPEITAPQHLHIGSFDNAGDDSGNAWPFVGQIGDVILYQAPEAWGGVEANAAFSVLRRRYLL